MRVLAIVNQKGGCGKTTTAINLSSALSRLGGRVLLVDLDPQGHCALGLSVPAQSLDRQVGDVLLSDLSRPPELTDVVWQVGDRLDLIPSNVRLAALEAAQGPLVRMNDRDRRLEQLLRYLASRYEWCVIDCPPHIGMLTFNALRASTEVLVPVEASFFSLQGAEHLLRTVDSVSRRVGRRMSTVLIPTMYDAQVRLGREIHEELKRRYGAMLAPRPIRLCQALREAAGFGRCVHDYAPQSEGAEDYLALARWLSQRWRSSLDQARSASAICGTLKGHDSGGAERLPMVRPATPGPVRPAGPGGSRGNERLATVQTCDAAEWPRLRSQVGDRAAEIAQRARTFVRDRRACESALGAIETGPHPPPATRGDEAPRATATAGPTEARREAGVVTIVYRPTRAVGAVYVVGEFGAGSSGRVAMPFDAHKGDFRAQIRVEPGRYRYRIEVDGSPMIDPQNPICESDENGQMFSVLAIPGVVGVGRESMR